MNRPIARVINPSGKLLETIKMKSFIEVPTTGSGGNLLLFLTKTFKVSNEGINRFHTMDISEDQAVTLINYINLIGND